MTASTSTSPVSTLVNAEVTLVNAVVATTEQVKQVATSALPNALAELHNAVEEAKGRIQSAAMLYRATLNDLSFDLASLTADILEDLKSVKPLPAPLVEEATLVSLPLPATDKEEEEVVTAVAANPPSEEPVAAPLVALQGTEEGETESSPTHTVPRAQKGKGRAAKGKVAKAYWLKGVPYCPVCVECDTPCMSAGEKKCCERATGAGNCGCCGKAF